MTDYKGIDYSGPSGTCNRNPQTGIRYGILPANNESLSEWFWDSFEPDYGEPTCPKCGNDAAEFTTEGEDFEHGRGCRDYMCRDCHYAFDGDEAFRDEPIANQCTDADYNAWVDDSNDLWIAESPYYTRAQFCSPCAPGACYLSNECSDGEKAYCLGHEWFRDNKAPYRVWRVSDNSEVLPS